jgi:hypothetical protein
MDAELKSYLEGMESRIADRITDRVAGRIDAVESRLKDFIAKADFDLETKIIAEFWKWGRSSDIRTREAIGDSSATAAKAQLLSERLLNVEDRVSALERGKDAA